MLLVFFLSFPFPGPGRGFIRQQSCSRALSSVRCSVSFVFVTTKGLTFYRRSAPPSHAPLSRRWVMTTMPATSHHRHYHRHRRRDPSRLPKSRTYRVIVSTVLLKGDEAGGVGGADAGAAVLHGPVGCCEGGGKGLSTHLDDRHVGDRSCLHIRRHRKGEGPHSTDVRTGRTWRTRPSTCQSSRA